MIKEIFNSKYFFLIILLLFIISFFFRSILSFIENIYLLSAINILYNIIFIIILLNYKKTKGFNDSEKRTQISLYIVIFWCILSSSLSMLNILNEMSI